MRLAGKVALITGGSSGIGAVTATLFAREGAAVAITGRDRARGDRVARGIVGAGGEATAARAGGSTGAIVLPPTAPPRVAWWS